MFYSQRVSNRKRRCANPTAFDHSWGWSAWRPLSVQDDIREDVQAAADEQHARKRSRTDAAVTSTPFVGNRFGVGVGDGDGKERNARIDSLAPKVEEEEPHWITKENSVLWRWVRELRASLEEVDSEDEKKPVQPPLEAATPTGPNDPIIHNPTFGRKRRHSFLATPTTTYYLIVARADIIRMARTRNMSRPEISLRREIYFQEYYLRRYKRDGGTRTYRHTATMLTRNRRHLLAYKRRGSGWRDLPVLVDGEDS